MQKVFTVEVDFDGFKVGNVFDSDVLARFMGSKNGDSVASLGFKTKCGHDVLVDFKSIGDQRISIDAEDADAKDIALKYMSNDDKDAISAKEFLENFESDCNNDDLTNESSLYMYKELNTLGVIDWNNNSWYEGEVKIVNSNGTILFRGYESDISLGGAIYASIEEIKTVVEDEELCEHTFFSYYEDSFNRDIMILDDKELSDTEKRAKKVANTIMLASKDDEPQKYFGREFDDNFEQFDGADVVAAFMKLYNINESLVKATNKVNHWISIENWIKAIESKVA